MNTRIYPLVIGITLASILASGCTPQESSAPTALASPATTVGTEIDDTVVTARVKSALHENKDAERFNIKVETRKGLVQLSGFVDNQARADLAIAIAGGVEGVKGVENGMTIKSGKVTVGNQIDDGIVTAKVKAALLNDESIKSFDIAVATRKGQVQLSGFVNNRMQIDRAIATTRSVEGVQDVVNEMSIKK
jgi:hyperosmotically inducible protein